ncbi:DUF3006 family protein [Alkalicoccus luteus]|uniref:DUF3006 domain-containing protein n=1 Tax=Alkalicoccus luteus TaxID=1237094 RepID=A0A969PS84_9BACI|nr:DUF3006 family protein [Alkalicoccus luteus]NJP38580.1 DUF3006 domain-containing protein [Alkalicoccus luteus]
MMKTCSGVVDRIVDGRTAVVLLEEQQRQLDLPLARLPSGVQEGHRLLVDVSETDGSCGRIVIDNEATKASRAAAAEAREPLLQGKERSRFKRTRRRT